MAAEATRHGWLRSAAAAVVATVMAAGSAQAQPAGSSSSPGADLIARGKYLTTMGDCEACHSAINSPKFAGGRLMPTPFGPIPTANITPDKETGIGNYTDDQFYRALHDGINAKGEYIYPVMPYPWYTKVTRDDVLAIKAYLFSLQPVHNKVGPNQMSFPFNVRTGLAVYDAMFLRAGEFKPDPSKSAEVNRGAYIVEGLEHCGECHNGRNLLGDTGLARSLQGAPIQNWYAPNITNDVHEGVGKYTDDQLFAYLKTGVAPGMGVVAGPMAETVHDSLSKLNDSDIKAIIAYLRQTKPEASYTEVKDSSYTGPQPAGRQTYLSYCASCHQLDGKGLPGAVPSLAGNGAVMAGGAENIERVVLGGIPAQGGLAPMPAVGASMTDQEVADVANYIRQSWGNNAPPNAGAGTVGELRPHTFTQMNLGPNGQCEKVTDQKLASVIQDPNSGILDALKKMTQATVLQTSEAIAAKVKARAPDAKRDDVVNSLTIAYCPIVEQDSQVPANLKVATLDQFSGRIYSVLKTDGKE
jgi:mono/diheme cytochrome c family protein